jgi:GntR family transcriptional regulator
VRFNVNSSADLPLYRQLMRQITDAIAGGRLAPGEKLKSHRELSEELVIAPLTVKKAYDELEALGYIETQRGRGTFVCEKLPRPNRADQRDRLTETARSLLSQAYLAGLDLPDVVELLRRTHTELKHTKDKE